jgi:signal peptidase I
MFFLTPKYLKNAKLLQKGVQRFLDYKRDLLPEKKLAEIEDLKKQLHEAIKAKDEKRISGLTETINKTCERALPESRLSAFAENVEVFFVSIVIAMGIRTYIAQPFKIPTGSMQPTLNGIIAIPTEDDPSPGFLGSALGFVTGTSYINAVSDHDGQLDPNQPITEHNFLLFFTYSKLHFTDGHTISISAPVRQLIEPGGLGLPHHTGIQIGQERGTTADGASVYGIAGTGAPIRKGQLLARGVLHSGDHVVVNKFAYHFRKPTRGEVFVFTTKNIDGIERPRDGGSFDLRWGSQHYIKRLVGVPGDTLDVRPPELFINGAPAKEPGIRRVIDNTGEAPHRQGYYGYQGYSPAHYIPLPVTLENGQRREYFAMGDNSYNSSDSRYWGPVPEQNVVGCGWFCYWPLTSHFGLIR